MNIKKFHVTLKIGGRYFKILFPEFEVEPLTVTAFTVKNRCVSFRIQANCNFDATPILSATSVPPFSEKRPYRITCRCSNILSKEVVFNRVLPLPSGQWDTSDMFCHAHDAKQMSLSPKLDDCLYGGHAISVSDQILTVEPSGGNIKCSRCLNKVGVHSKGYVNFWTSCITLPYENLSPCQQFVRLVKKAVTESVSVFAKVLLESQTNEQYLTIWVMDKQLQVLRADENLALNRKQVMKLKYTYYPTSNDQVQAWHADVCVQHIQITEAVFNAGFEYLVLSTRDIPPMFNLADGEFLAYLESPSGG